MELGEGVPQLLPECGMNRALIIGKFMPIHEGHIAMIRFAAEQCDEVIVSMSYTENDPINHILRFAWIRDIFKYEFRIKAFIIKDDFDDDTLPLEERTEKWAEVMRSVYPPVNILVSSEEYGEPFARHLNANHILFDIDRLKKPVSATLIRQQPHAYWEFIPEVVRPYFVHKICFYGPESTGKSSMAKRMAERFHTEYVPEVAREMLITNDFSVDDIINIGHGQTDRIFQKTKTANRFLFCDTDLITTQIYSQHYLNTVPTVLRQLENQVRYAHYFFLDIDTQWIPDGLRDLGERREEMRATFIAALEQRGISFTIVSGEWMEREQIVVSKMRDLFGTDC